MRKPMNVDLTKLNWSLVDGDYIHLFRVDAFLPTGSLEPHLWSHLQLTSIPSTPTFQANSVGV
jgi:hypothetical protein